MYTRNLEAILLCPRDKTNMKANSVFTKPVIGNIKAIYIYIYMD